jgi:hypothetical protein
MSGRKVGRPPDGTEAKKSPLSLRTTAEVRDLIEKAAEESGRSLAQEVEFRVKQSFIHDQILGSGTNSFWTVAIAAVKQIEKLTGKTWTGDAVTFLSVKAAINTTLDDFQPLDISSVEKILVAQANTINSLIDQIPVMAAEVDSKFDALEAAHKSKGRPSIEEVMAHDQRAETHGELVMKLLHAVTEYAESSKQYKTVQQSAAIHGGKEARVLSEELLYSGRKPRP